MLEFRLLGPVAVIASGRSLPLGEAKQRALLAVLLLHPNQVVPVENLINLLWDDPPDTAANALQVYVSRLRRVLTEETETGGTRSLLVHESPGYRLTLGPGQLDLQHFEQLVAHGRRELAAGNPGQASTALRAALELWHGPPLANVRAPFVEPERVRLEESRLAAVEARLDAELQLGRASNVLGELEALMVRHPLHERFCAQLMLALYQSGRQHDALLVYKRLSDRLDEEQGAQPGPALQKLYVDILEQADSLEVGPVRSRTQNRSSLPIQLTSFVGRTVELSASKRHLLDTRLLTLVGPGGAGKTRLAVELASQLRDSYRDGVAFVSLATITEQAVLVSTIASALDVRQTGERSLRDALFESARQLELLLVLDNFEQVVDSAVFVAELLQQAPGIQAVVTSRASLGVRGEQQFPVPPLRVPESSGRMSAAEAVQFEAVQLFLERARAVKPSFELTSSNVTAVIDICARLDGLPLAIELAAAHIKALPPEALLEQLTECLRQSDRGPPDAEPRHRTLWAAIDWSYGLLPDGDRAILRQLGTFSGSWSLQAAERVCCADQDGTVVPKLLRLVDASLVQPEEGPGGQARFMLLETIRDYSRERLAESGEAALLRQRHAAFYAALAEESEAALRGSEQPLWLARMDRDHANYRAVVASSELPDDDNSALSTAAALWMFWLARGYFSEGRAYLQRCLVHAQGSDPVLRARALNGAGALGFQIGEFDAARAEFTAALDAARSAGHDRTTGIVLNSLGNLAWSLGKYDEAESWYQQSLELRRQLEDRFGMAMCLNNLGTLASDQAHFDEAQHWHEESLAIRRMIGDASGIAQSLHNLGEVALRRGTYDAALAHVTESLTRYWELGNKMYVADELGAFSRLAEITGDYKVSARWFGATAALRRAIHVKPALTDRDTYERSLRVVRNALGDDAFRTAWASGETVPLEEIVKEMLEWSAAGRH